MVRENAFAARCGTKRSLLTEVTGVPLGLAVASANTLLRDRDGVYGEYFRRRVKGLGIKEVLTAARSPWQNPYVEEGNRMN